MGEQADRIIEDGIISDIEDEYYEDRLIAQMRGEGMSVAAIGASMEIPVDDVIASLEWSRGDKGI